tara:strand:+ start:424 stop:681 length:258 start_codon:yes stop_codon:yes gene_type:complete
MFFSLKCCNDRRTVSTQARAAAYTGFALLTGAIVSGATEHYIMMGGFFILTAAAFITTGCLAHRAEQLQGNAGDEKEGQMLYQQI